MGTRQDSELHYLSRIACRHTKNLQSDEGATPRSDLTSKQQLQIFVQVFQISKTYLLKHTMVIKYFYSKFEKTVFSCLPGESFLKDLKTLGLMV